MTTTVLESSPAPAAAGQASPHRWRGSSLATQIWVLTARSLRTLVTDPRAIVLTLLQPVILLVLFSQVFKSLSGTAGFPAGVTYIDYLVPAILVNTAMQSALQAGVGLTSDLTNGVIGRFRAMPIWMGSVLLARSLSDLARGFIQLVIMLVLAALVFGFSPAGGIAGVLGALILALVVGWGLGWVFMAAASWIRNAELMQTTGFLVMFPLMFASSGFVPISSLPGWLQAIAHVNPMTYAIDAARHLALGTPAGSSVVVAVAVSLGLAVAGAAVALRGIRRP